MNDFMTTERRSTWKKRVAWAGAVLLTAGVLFLFLRPEPVSVEIGAAVTGMLQVTLDNEGETRAHDRYVVTAPVAGRLARVELHPGDEVSEGQAIMRIAALPLSARELEEARGRLAAAEALRGEASQRVRLADEQLRQARREQARLRQLATQGFVTPQVAEQADSAAAAAALEVSAARARVRAATAEARVARAALAALRPGAGGNGTTVVVRAPVTGKVLQLPDQSERVVAAGMPLMTLGSLAHLEVVIPVLSSEAVQVRPGMPVLIEGWGGETPLHARVRQVEPQAVTKVSALGVEEKRTNVIADFVDPPGALGDGYRVTARIVVSRADSVLKVPSSALFRCGEQWCVFALEQGRARRRVVQVGPRNVTEVTIVDGLRAGETVIRFPGSQVDDGVRVSATRD
jgi:HlyD family secretion protein